jgi:hypothetical protein
MFWKAVSADSDEHLQTAFSIPKESPAMQGEYGLVVGILRHPNSKTGECLQRCDVTLEHFVAKAVSVVKIQVVLLEVMVLCSDTGKGSWILWFKKKKKKSWSLLGG